MARPRKDAPRPDTRLVALRLPRELLAVVDEHARRAELTRSAAVRDLLARGLRTTGLGKDLPEDATALPCPWCKRPPGQGHLEDCPRHPSSPLHALLRGGRGRQ